MDFLQGFHFQRCDLHYIDGILKLVEPVHRPGWAWPRLAVLEGAVWLEAAGRLVLPVTGDGRALTLRIAVLEDTDISRASPPIPEVTDDVRTDGC